MSKAVKYLQYLFKAKSAHGVHSPFVYKFIQELIETKNEDYYPFKELDLLRGSLILNKEMLEVEDLGAGSKIFKDNKRRVGDIVKFGTSKKKFSELYFKLINFSKAVYIVEMGTSVGLNTLYLAKANSNSKVVTIEGSKTLYEFSKKLFRDHEATNINSVNNSFDNAFPEALKHIPQLDFLFVDGNHTYGSTMQYFNLALSKKTNDSVFVFDDINWSEEMERAWNEIKNHPDVTLTIDLFYVGIVFFRHEQKQKEHFLLRF